MFASIVFLQITCCAVRVELSEGIAAAGFNTSIEHFWWLGFEDL